MLCLLWLTDGSWREQELPDEFLMQADRNLDYCSRQGIVNIEITDGETGEKREHDCKDILMDIGFFNGEFLRSRS